MKTLIIIFVAVTALASPSQALEERTSHFQVSAELGGASLLYDVFGSIYLPYNFVLNAGVSLVPVTSSSSNGSITATGSSTIFQIPVSLSYLIGDKNHFLEILAGGDIITSSANVSTSGVNQRFSESGFLPEAGLGYRYWPFDGGFHFRATLYGIFSNIGTIPWFGLSFGYAF